LEFPKTNHKNKEKKLFHAIALTSSITCIHLSPFDLPQGYTPPQIENPTESGLSQPRPTQASVAHPNGTLVIQGNDYIAAGFPMPQGTTENTMLVYHSSNPSGPQREHTKPSIDLRPPAVGENEEVRGKILTLEKRVKVMEGNSEFGLDPFGMCLDLNVVIPPKFKIPDFEKYKGLTCPCNHLIMYC
jgi:hypothetical protein